MVTGKIRTLRVDKGFGFIKDDTGKEYFFHQSAVYGEGLDNLREGDSVEFDVGEEVHADDGQPEGETVPNRSCSDRGKQDHGEKLDGRDGAQRERVDREVEARVHHGEDDPERDDESLRRSVHPGERAPRPPPEREHRSCADDPKPGDAEWLDAREE